MDYKSHRWLQLRESILRRDKWRCREAARYGKRVQATTVHHIYPVEDYPGWQWQPWNLIAVSGEAHNLFHDRATGKLTAAGLAWQQRTPPPLDAPEPFCTCTGAGRYFRRRENGGGG